ncbi:MAG TPA: RNA 2',3'-cyclic phosphodiesterase [Sphingomicrobium sp.]|nr:RNA 2',3'-cyclic phosphodiesterase [Sphingomicrobium sp.]
MHRLFVAIRPPDPVIDLLIDTMEGYSDLRWQSDEQLHLTLRFIGEVERPFAEDLATALSALRSERFSLRLAGLGRFDRKRGGTLWAGVEPRACLVALASKVERICVGVRLPPERRAFHPHISVARWSGRAPDLSVLLARPAGLHSVYWEVDRITLYESHLAKSGANYEAIAEIALD